MNVMGISQHRAKDDYSNFYAKLRVAVLCARPGRGFATKISTPAGCIFGQSLALKSSFPRTFCNEIRNSPLTPLWWGKQFKNKEL